MKRIYHPYWSWECYHAGFFNTTCEHDKDVAIGMFKDFLSDQNWFELALIRVLKEWPISCEQFLSNTNINRIAWLGQASMCIETGVPACFRAGFSLLTIENQKKANALAMKYLKRWTNGNGKDREIYSLVEN